MRFGEALLQAGALSREQLTKALDMQKILGGRLGTNILELGYLDEASLLDHLSRFRSTQGVSSDELKKISPAVLRSIPSKLALRYGLVPFQTRGKTLHVASMNPGDALQEDEISFLTSFMVRTHVALELNLSVALHRYYKAPLAQRFVALVRRRAAGGASRPPASSRPAGEPRSGPPSPSAGLPAAPRVTAPATAAPTTTAPAVAATTTLSADPAAVSGPSTAPSPVPSPPPAVEAQPATGQSFQNLNTPAPDVEFIELDADDLALLRGSGAVAEPVVGEPVVAEPAVMEPAGPSPGPTPVEPAGSPVPEPSLGAGLAEAPLEPVPDALLPSAAVDDLLSEPESEDDLEADVETRLMNAARELQAADIRDEIGDVLLDFSAAYYRRRALVIRRKESLVGWMAGGEGLAESGEAGIRDLSLEATAPSVFFGLQEPGSFWLGPLPLLPANRDLVEVLGGEPRDCLVLPISLRSKIVGYLYVDNLDQGVAGTPVAEMKRLVAKAGLAFEVYILKNKIRMM